MASQGIGKILILAVEFLTLLGLLPVFWQRIPFLGRLPGDIFIDRGNLHIFLRIATYIIISLMLSIVLNPVIHLFR